MVVERLIREGPAAEWAGTRVEYDRAWYPAEEVAEGAAYELFADRVRAENSVTSRDQGIFMNDTGESISATSPLPTTRPAQVLRCADRLVAAESVEIDQHMNVPRVRR